MPGEFGAGLERISLAAQNFRDTLGGEIHVDEAGTCISDLAIVGDAAVAQTHDRDSLEHSALAARFWQQRRVAECVASIEDFSVADRIVHVPAHVSGGLEEPIVDHLGDFYSPGKLAVENVVVDPILSKQIGEALAVAALNCVAEFSQHHGRIHRRLPCRFRQIAARTRTFRAF